MPFVASSAEFFTDFNSGTPPGTQAFGNAVVNPVGGINDSGMLRLTPADKDKAGNFIVGELDQQPVHSFVVRFKALVGSGWRTGADGFCFNFARNLPKRFHEEGSGKGLSVTFDTYTKNGAGPHMVRVKYDGNVLGEQTGLLRTGKRFVDVEIQLSAGKTLNVFYDGTHIIKNMVVKGYTATRGDFGFGARTGDMLDNHCIEDLSIVTETGDGPLIARTEKRKQQPQNTAAPPPGGEVFWYLNESETFKGTLFKPGGKGPFPAIVFCQHHPASDAAENFLPRLTEACVSQGYVLLIPGRHPLNAPNNVGSSSGAEKRFLQENEFQAANLYSALQVLKARSYVDEKRIAVMGHGAGAISLLFAFPQDLGVRGLLLFSPDRAAWDAFPSVRPRLLRTVENATIPVFVGHRADKDEEPFLSFKEIVEKKGPPNHAKRFKVMGGKPGNGEIVPDAAELRQDRVFLFLEEVMK